MSPIAMASDETTEVMEMVGRGPPYGPWPTIAMPSIATTSDEETEPMKIMGDVSPALEHPFGAI
jgi:hypothetical protein